MMITKSERWMMNMSMCLDCVKPCISYAFITIDYCVSVRLLLCVAYPSVASTYVGNGVIVNVGA